MHASVIFGSIVCLAILFLIIKVLINLVTNSNILKYEIPQGWEAKLSARYKVYNNLSLPEQKMVSKKTQILVAQKRIKGLEGLQVTIDLRLALSFQMSLLNLQRSSANVYSKVSPISVFPYSMYNQLRERSSYTLYWDQDNAKLFLETPENILVEDSYYLWLKVDKRFSRFNDLDLLKIHDELSSGVWPITVIGVQSLLINKKI